MLANFFPHPVCQTDETRACRLQQHVLPVRHAVEAELSEGHVKLEVALGHRLNLVAEALEGLEEEQKKG